jgi:ketosteroid isomerase-like protein
VKRIFPTPQDAETAFYEALERADLDAMMEVWAEDEEIVCVHPSGPRLAGYEQVREAWARIFGSGQRLNVRLSNLVQVVSGMVAVHSVHENIAVVNDRASAVAVATNIYVRSASGWRLLAHHASSTEALVQAPQDPQQTLH